MLGSKHMLADVGTHLIQRKTIFRVFAWRLHTVATLRTWQYTRSLAIRSNFCEWMSASNNSPRLRSDRNAVESTSVFFHLAMHFVLAGTSAERSSSGTVLAALKTPMSQTRVVMKRIGPWNPDHHQAANSEKTPSFLGHGMRSLIPSRSRSFTPDNGCPTTACHAILRNVRSSWSLGKSPSPSKGISASINSGERP